MQKGHKCTYAFVALGLHSLFGQERYFLYNAALICTEIETFIYIRYGSCNIYMQTITYVQELWI